MRWNFTWLKSRIQFCRSNWNAQTTRSSCTSATSRKTKRKVSGNNFLNRLRTRWTCCCCYCCCCGSCWWCWCQLTLQTDCGPGEHVVVIVVAVDAVDGSDYRLHKQIAHQVKLFFFMLIIHSSNSLLMMVGVVQLYFLLVIIPINKLAIIWGCFCCCFIFPISKLSNYCFYW